MSTFGEVFKHLRRIEGVTLEELAKRLRTHKGYLSGVEREKVAPPSSKVCRRIAKAFEATLLGLGYTVSVEDWLEFSWASKAPVEVRGRVMDRLRYTKDHQNPLTLIEVAPRIVTGKNVNAKNLGLTACP